MKSIFIFYPICVTAEFEVRIQTAQEMSDGGSYNQILIGQTSILMYYIWVFLLLLIQDKTE